MHVDKQYDLLLTISNQITRVRGKEELLRVITGVLKKHIPFNDSFIMRYDKEKRSCTTYIYHAEQKRLKHSLFHNFLELEYPVLDDSIGDDEYPIVYNVEDLLPYGGEQIVFMSNSGIKEFVVLKLVEGNALTGLFILLSEQLNAFTQEDQELLHRLSYQISIATANLIASEEIVKREEEKTLLLSLSYEIAALRSREDLFRIVNSRLKPLFSLQEFGIAQIHKDQKTYGAFILDEYDNLKYIPGYHKVTSAQYDIHDPIFSAIFSSDGPVLLQVSELLLEPGAPDYVKFWNQAGFIEVLCLALRAGGTDVGCVFLHPEPGSLISFNTRMLTGVCAQLSVAVLNVLSNEEIERRESEKSRLLMFSNAIASVIDKKVLAVTLNKQLHDLFGIKDYAIHALNADKKTHYPILFDPKGHFVKHIEYLDLIKIQPALNEKIFNAILANDGEVIFNTAEWFHGPAPTAPIKTLEESQLIQMTGAVIELGEENIAVMTFRFETANIGITRQPLFRSICSQIAITVSNLIANEKINNQLIEISRYKQQLEQEKLYLKEEIATGQNYADIIGDGAEIKKVFKMLSQVASSASTVLLYGETGTGKELIARAIHNASPRRNKLMIKVNCAALPPNLIESELFGHERGSFTGATERRLGKFELANLGTLFLDEIGEMPLELQVKLLRAIQEREIERVGGSTQIKVDVRIIAATNRNLEQMMEEGKFRSDLYYRLNIFPISLPPLRDRREDIPALALYFLARYSKKAARSVQGFSNKVLKELVDYNWPGNIRELEHLVERSVLLAKGDIINEIHLQPGKTKAVTTSARAPIVIKTLDENEKEYILNILKHCRGKITGAGGAAELLGVPPGTLNSKIKKLGIKKEFFS